MISELFDETIKFLIVYFVISFPLAIWKIIDIFKILLINLS